MDSGRRHAFFAALLTCLFSALLACSSPVCANPAYAEEADGEALIGTADVAASQEGEQEAQAVGATVAEQLASLGISSDPEQAEGYDASLDSDASEGADLLSDDSEAEAAEPSPLSDGDSTWSGDWSYHAQTSGGTTVYVLDGYKGSQASITLPDSLDGHAITKVCFYGSTSGGLASCVTKVTLSKTVQVIGAQCFRKTNVAEVVTRGSAGALTTIQDEAFRGTAITSFTMPSTLTTLGQRVFNQSKLQSVTFGANLGPCYENDQVNGLIHYYNPLAGVPVGVRVTVPSGCKNYKVQDGALLSKDGTVLYSQMSDLAGGTYSVPSGVTILAGYAMYCNATVGGVDLPAGLVKMEGYCLHGTGIATLVIPDSVTYVRWHTCSSCTSLTSVKVGTGLKQLGTGDFDGCTSLASVDLGGGLQVIGMDAFYGDTALTSINLPSNVTTVAARAFSGASRLTSVTGGKGLRYIYANAFANTGLTSFPFGSNLRFVSNTAFNGCSFTPRYPSYLEDGGDGYYSSDNYLVLDASKCYAMAYRVFDLVNARRAEQGLSALTMDKNLLDAAMTRATELAVLFDHTRPTGARGLTVCSKAHAENIAMGETTADAVMADWMGSADHKASILSSDAKSIGIGCVLVGGTYHWVQLFGTSAAAACSQPADMTNAQVKVLFSADALANNGVTFGVRAYSSDGKSLRTASETVSTEVGKRQQFAAVVYKYGGRYSKLDGSCVSWSVDKPSVASMDSASATVIAKAAGDYTVTASIAGGNACASATHKVKAASNSASGSGTSGGGSTGGGASSGGTPSGSTSGSSGSGTSTTWFYDVSNSGEWYYSWVMSAAQRNLMSGDKDGSGNLTHYFRPNDSISRAEVATVLWRIAGSPSTTTTPLWDAKGHWAATAIAWCQSQGIITGYTDGQYKGMFRPDAQVSREEFATMVYRFARWAGVKVSNPSASAFNKCADTALVGWSHDYMLWCAAAGIITGKDMNGTYYLAPQESATRAQAAKIFTQLAKMALDGVQPYSSDDEGEQVESADEQEGATAEASDGQADATAVEAIDGQDEVTYTEVEPTFDDPTAVSETSSETVVSGTSSATSNGQGTGVRSDEAESATDDAQAIDPSPGDGTASPAAAPQDCAAPSL